VRGGDGARVAGCGVTEVVGRGSNPAVADLKAGATYQDIPSFCESATTEEIAADGYVLTPGRYVAAEEIEGGDEPFEEKMQWLTAKLEEQFAEAGWLEGAIRRNLRHLRYSRKGARLS
jgi:type I restriction-modification system DNA methylase subunit